MNLTAWELFNRNFKPGDDVIFINDEDFIGWGKLLSFKVTGFNIQRTGMKRRFIEWDDIRFMSHDGFPIRQLFGADGSYSIQEASSDTHALRNALKEEFNGLSQLVFADPFMLENVKAELQHAGNDGPEYYGEDGEECLEMIAVDGARGMLWHLPSVHHVELA